MVEERVLNDTKKLLNFFFETVLKGITVGETAMLKSIDRRNKERANERLLPALANGDTIRQIVVPDSDFNEFMQCLNAIGLNKKSYQVVNLREDTGKLIYFPQSVEDKIIDANNLLTHNKGFLKELKPELFILKYTTEDIDLITGLSLVEVEMFRKKSLTADITFAFTEEETGYTLSYLSRDKNEVESILKQMSWDLTGRQGEQVKQTISNEIEVRSNMVKTLSEKNEFNIVSVRNPDERLYIDKNYFMQFKGNNIVKTVYRDNPSFEAALHSAIKGISEPVILTTDEYERNKYYIKDYVSGKHKKLEYTDTKESEISLLRKTMTTTEAKEIVEAHEIERDNYYSKYHSITLTRDKKSVDERLNDIKTDKSTVKNHNYKNYERG